MSITRKWFKLEVVTLTVLPPVADAPIAGASLYVSVLSVQLLVTWYTEKLPAVVTVSTYRRNVALLTVAPEGTVARSNWM
jgi:hypothetical protein